MISPKLFLASPTPHPLSRRNNTISRSFCSVRRICIGDAARQHHYGRACRQQGWYGGGCLSWLLCSFRNRAYSFCDCAHQLCTHDDDLHQKCNYRLCFRPCDSQHPQNCGNDFGIFEITVDLDFIKISTHMPSVYSASNDLCSFLSCFAVLCVYLILAVFASFRILKHQDIK